MKNKTLYKKIFELKKEVGKISKDSNNPFYKSKYFDINQLLEHLEPIFSKYNILCLQPIINERVVTRLVDMDSDESIESEISLPSLSDAQKIGSCITYYRRYSLQSLLGLQAQDDDGNKACGKVTPKTSELPYLNIMDNQKNLTFQWKNVVEGIRKGTVKSVTDVKKVYRLSVEVEKKLNELLTSKN